VIRFRRARSVSLRVAANQGVASRVTHHRRMGRVGADGRRTVPQFYVHWQGLPSAYGEWLSDEVLRQLPTVAHIHTNLTYIDSGVADP
jgi:hypothetical protein